MLLTIISGYLFPLPLLLGWAADKAWGDPASLPHPVAGFGRLIAWGERRLNKGKGKVLKGGILAAGLVVSTFAFSFAGLYLAYTVSAGLHLPVCALLIFYCLAGTTLIREVRLVFEATDRSPEEGRKQLSRIVGRDTCGLSAQKVRTAALETLSENLSDGVIAPLFWYLLLGVPGALAYKMVNTLDSMIGYKNERYLQFGRVAARMDDAFNYIPARLTALLMIAAGGGKRSLIRFVGAYGRRHPSPNAGYPEAALAGLLQCRFGGPGSYFGKLVDKPYIGYREKTLTSSDMRKAIRINRYVEAIMVLATGGVQLLAVYFFR
jgi:adenosylcobinamide-phosphate synthase